MQKLISIGISLLGIGFLIFIHELGHFLFCKLFKLPVPIFSIGFGPVLMQKEYHGTKFVLSLIPLGGFVQMGHPEEEKIKVGEELESTYEVDMLKKKKLYQGALILLGGIIFNLLFAYVAMVGLSVANKIPENIIKITQEENYTKKNIDIDNKIEKINDFSKKDDIGSHVNLRAKINDGICIVNALIFKTINGIKSLFSERKFNQLSGIVGIVNGGMNAAHKSFINFLIFLIFVSINLAVANLLPLPILDGGQLIMLIASKVFRIKNMEFIHMIAFYFSVFLLAVIMIYSTWNDLIRIFMA